jgi:DNA-binding MarR family transcriptional regulator
VTLFNDGVKQNDIAEELGIDKSNVSRHIKRARETGLLDREHQH